MSLLDAVHMQNESAQINPVASFYVLSLAIYVLSSIGVNLSFQQSFFVVLTILLVVYKICLTKILIWSVINIYLIVSTVKNYFLVANHHFLLMFIAMQFLLLSLLNLSSKYYSLAESFRIFIIILMYAAAFQKLISPNFVSGAYLGYVFLTGGFFNWAEFLFQDYSLLIKENIELIKHLDSIDPSINNSIMLNTVLLPNQKIMQFLSWFIICAEFALAFLFMFKCSVKLRHIVLITFIVLIFMTRSEFGFLTLVCILGLGYYTDGYPRLRNTYILFIITLNILVLCGSGYR